MISYIIETVKPIVDEVIIVTSAEKKEGYLLIFPKLRSLQTITKSKRSFLEL